jgi:arylsulfatase A-like enzyme
MKHLVLPAARGILGTVLGFALGGCGGDDPGPSILLITLDTTRADRLSCYGYDKPTTPNIDRLAADGVRFTNAYAVSSWTLPTHASLFTGKFPSSHGAKYDPEGPINLVQGIKGDPRWDAYKARPIAENEVTLASLLAERGYTTGAVVAGPWLKRVFRLDKGFEFYDDSNFEDLGEAVGELNGRPAEDVTRAAIEFVDAHGDEPFFLFLNYYDPHFPRAPREPFRSRFWPHPIERNPSPECQNALYDAEVAYMDAHVGALLDHLRERGLYEDLWIVVLSDHGELMGEDDLWGHGDSLFEKEIEIPLLIKEPGAERRRGVDDSFVQQVDLLPTILERVGIELPANVQGVPIGSGGAHPIVAETNPLPFMSATKLDRRQKGEWRVLLHDKEKFVWSGEGNHALYDLARDPLELENRAALEPETARRMQGALEMYFASLPPPGATGEVIQPTDQVLKELQSLGYLGDAPPQAPAPAPAPADPPEESSNSGSSPPSSP